MPRPRGAPAPEGCDAAREREYFIHEERETKAAGPALLYARRPGDSLSVFVPSVSEGRGPAEAGRFH